ncbi:hypothetical protein ACJRO7_019055 [Eucalyptus globulus]|uniref:F-box protein n=1 Tax=Eucalyptus globulus TaxID=34317 RepID=A0ABD3KX51_EUCGL
MASFLDDITIDILLRLSVKSLTSHLDPSFGHPDRYDVIGSCNGVVCLSIYYKDGPNLSNIFIWNPSIHECMVVPQHHCHVSGLIAFGINPLGGHLDDFKVVTINFYFGAHPDCHSSQAQIYSLRSNFRKEIGKFAFQNFICWCPHAHVDGRIVMSLVSSDTIEEIFREITLSDSMPSEEEFITLFDGCLSLITQNALSQCYEGWTIKKFGVTEAVSSAEVLLIKSFHFGLCFNLPSYIVSCDARRREFTKFNVEVNLYFHSHLGCVCLCFFILFMNTNLVFLFPRT